MGLRSKLAYFMAGALFGSVLAYKFAKAEAKANEEDLKKEMQEVVEKSEEAIEQIKKYKPVSFSEEVVVKEMHVEDKKDLPGVPDYEIITPDQFNDNELEYEQRELTFHSGDSVLEDEGVIESDIDDLLGPGSLDMAGRKSADNEVYIRNNLLQMEYAVTIEDDFFFDDEPEEY